MSGNDRPPSPSPSQLPPIPSSPTFTYASTTNPLSSYSLPLPPPPRPVHLVLTKSDLEHSHTAYTDLLTTAKSYRQALATLSVAASSFGSALESCARLKEARAESLSPPSGPASSGAPFGSNSFHGAARGTCTADALLATAGLQHLVANHQQILSETVYRSFEVPLLHELDKWRAAVDDESESYATAARAQSGEIRRLEKEGLKLHRQRRRDVAGFREHLVHLTTKLDGLTGLHADHARTLLRESQETSVRIVDASCSLVRAEVDIFESLARKGWSGGGLEDVLEKGVDLFAADDGGVVANPGSGPVGGNPGPEGHGSGGGGGGGSTLFSILPPKSILADSGSDNLTVVTARPGPGGHARSDSLLDGDLRYQSLAGAAVGHHEGRDSDSVFSEFNRPRLGGVRPFSPQPQPLRMNPDHLVAGSYEEEHVARPTESGTGADEDDDDGARDDPWRNEGLGSEQRESKDQDTPSESPSPSLTGSRRLERRWSVTEDTVVTP